MLYSSNWSVEDHAVYLSTIKVISQDNRVEIYLNIFEDDLRDAIRNHRGTYVDTASTDFVPSVNSYLLSHFSVSDGIEPMPLEVHEVKRIGDAYQVVFYPLAESFNTKILFKADYLMELFPTQQNILQMEFGEQKYYHIFRKGKERTTIQLTD